MQERIFAQYAEKTVYIHKLYTQRKAYLCRMEMKKKKLYTHISNTLNMQKEYFVQNEKLHTYMNGSFNKQK